MAMGFDQDGNLYVELDNPVNVQGEDYNIRLTRLVPRVEENDPTTLHVDYQRISDSASGRFESQVFPPRGGADSLAYFQGLFTSMLQNDTPVVSPVY